MARRVQQQIITIWLVNKRSMEKADECVVDHSDYVTSREQETDKRYCMEKNNVYGISCDVCKRKFVDKMSDDNMVPTMKSPIWVCISCHDHKYTHSLCPNCHMKKLDNDNGRKHRRRN